jgi:hypothetical protein
MRASHAIFSKDPEGLPQDDVKKSFVPEIP